MKRSEYITDLSEIESIIKSIETEVDEDIQFWRSNETHNEMRNIRTKTLKDGDLMLDFKSPKSEYHIIISAEPESDLRTRCYNLVGKIYSEFIKTFIEK